jgi:hypothetical protein
MQYSPEQQKFISEHYIDTALIFDGSGMHIQKVKYQMKQTGHLFAI